MKKIFLAVITGLFLVSIGCKTENKKAPTTDEILDKASKTGTIDVGNKNFVVDVPNGWTTKDTTLNNIEFYFLMAPQTGDNFNTNMNILNESMQNASFEEYKEQTTVNLKKMIPSAVVLNTGDITAGDLKGAWTHYTMQQNGMDLDLVNYVFPKDGVAYIITATTKQGYMDKYRSAFDGVAKSFRFKN